LKPGKRYDYWGAFQAAERIRSKLVKLGYRSALIDVEEHPRSSGEMDVVFALETGKRIRIVWTGAVPGKRFRKRIEALWDGRLSEDVLADTLARRAEYALRAEKYFQARVTPSLEGTGEEITIRFDVAEGNKGQRVFLSFEGNDSLPDAKLRGVLPKRDTPDFFAAVGEETSKLRRAIHVLYASEGFLRGRVTDIRASYSEESREFLVTIAVDEGPRAMVASVSLPPEAAEYKGPDAPHIDLVPDTPFRIEGYLNSRTALYGFYSGEGYFQPQVSGILKPAGDKIAVLFTVEKGPLARVGEIRMARPSRIRQSRVEKLLTLKEGDQILPTELALSRKRLFETRAFQSVDIQTIASEEGPEVRDVVVDLIDKPEVEVNYGLRYTLLNPTYLAESGEEKYSPFEVGGGLLFVNPFGFGHRYGASGYVFGKTQFYRLFYETDTFFGLRFPTQVILSQDWLQELQLSRVNSRINRVTFQQHYLWGERTESLVGGERLRLQWNYSFRHIRLSYVDEQVPAYDTDRGSISLSLIGDTRDSFVDPARGSFWSVTSEFASQWLASDVNFTKLFAQGYLFVPLGKKTVWASGLRIGAVPGENPLLIIEDRFRAGGVYSVRGFPLNSLGPKNDLGEPLGGQAVLIFNQELRFPLYRSLYGGAFYDTGNVFALADLMRLGDLRHCAGVGLRYMLPFGPIRLDWAYVLDPKPGEDRYRFSFTIGHIF
jgi:outer membrane protein insertion porin family